jgi:hypothetical protein
MVSLLFPAWARLCLQPWVPPKKRERVLNQPAFRQGARQPGLLLHETIDVPSGRGSHGEEADSFPVFVEGIPAFPSPYLRLELSTRNPTVGLLRKKLAEVTGGQFTLSHGSIPLGAARQYLHQAGGVGPGSVISAKSEVCSASGTEKHAEGSVASGQAVRSPANVTALAAIYVPDVHALAHGEASGSDQDAEAGESFPSREHEEVAVKRRLLHAGKGGTLWAGSSRRRLLSTGERPAREEGGAALQASLDALSDAEGAGYGDSAGGFFRQDDCPA